MARSVVRPAGVLFLLALAPARAAEEEFPVCRCALAILPDAAPLTASGVPALDARLYAEAGFVKTVLGVEPVVLLLPESANRSAFAHRGDNGKGIVGFDAKALRHRLWSGKHRHAAVAVALAHQCAHVLQWQKGARTFEKNRELHADFLSGYFLGRRNFGTIGGEASLDPEFAAMHFSIPDDATNLASEHGAPDERARALSFGFRAARTEKLTPAEAYEKASALYPVPRVGYAERLAGEPAPAAPPDPVDGYLSPLFGKVKLPCTHRVPCTHKIACAHPLPCTHKTACRHQSPCIHRTPCTHKVACRHQMPCVHRVPCVHKVRCVHAIPCRHLEHDCDYDADGRAIPCIHTRHRFDYAHNFDYEHDWDFEHEYDTEHEFDFAHEFDTEHPWDPLHEYDMAHEWDTQHPFDLAHESDLAHDFDVRLLPK